MNLRAASHTIFCPAPVKLMNSTTVRKLHRWLGLVFSVSALMASGSGVLHNVMTWTQAPPPPAQPGGPKLDPATVKIPLADALRAVPDAANGVKAVNLRVISGEPWYVVWPQGAKTPAYVSAVTGKLDAGRDEIFAAEIAARFLGGKQARKTDYLTAFNDEYINIFRILPVHRFDADDGRGTRVYVSTMTESVTRHTDDHRQREASIFSNFHKLQFIKSKPLRDGVLTTMTFGIFCVSLAGIVLFFLTRPRKPGAA